MPELALHLIGTPQIASDSVPLALTRRKGVALLAYLAVTGSPQRRDTLAALLWPGYDQSSARGHLRRTLYAMKSVIGDECLIASHNELALADNRVWADVREFGLAINRQIHDQPNADALSQALRLYRGDFLQGFSVDDSPEFDAWQRQEAELLRAMFLSGSETLISMLQANGDDDAAIQVAQRCLLHLPGHEPVHRALMALYARTNRQTEALRQFARCREALLAQLNVKPDAATLALYDQIRRGEGPTTTVADTSMPETGQSSIKAMVDDLARPQFKVPILPTAFVPRYKDMQTIKGRLADPKCRLLVLFGPGGVGKTYLATQVAQDLTADSAAFPDGVFWVDLTGYDTADAVPSAVADSLGIRFHRDDPEVTQIVAYLADKSLLLVFDNFEHLIDAAELISRVLAGAGRCKVLVTSRVALQLTGEWLLSIGGMLYPEAGADLLGSDEVELNQYSAVRLFHEAGCRHRNRFSLQENRSTIVRICQLVDGMPLALELAASWLKSMNCAKIIEWLESDVGMLSTRLRDVPARHASIQDIFDYSWDLLPDRSQQILARLSVLQGQFGFEAVQAVAQATHEDIEQLIEHSFLRRVESSNLYAIHELLRQFAARRLAEDPALMRSVREKHAGHFARFLAARATSIGGPDQESVLNEISANKDNIRAAWRWSARNGHISSLETMLVPHFEFYFVRSLFQEGVGAAQEALATAVSSNSEERFWAQIHNRLAQCHFYLGDQQPSTDHASTALDLAQRANTADERAFALRIMGMNATVQDDFARANDCFSRALDADRQLDNKAGEAITLFEMGRNELDIGNPQLARQYFEQSLTISRRLQHHGRIAYALDMLAFADFNLGNFERSADQFDEALRLFEALGDRRGIGKTLGGAARAQLSNGTGDVQAVLDDGELALALFTAIGDWREEMGRLWILTQVTLYDARDVVAARNYIDRALHISASWPDHIEHVRALLTTGLVAIFEGDFMRARSDLLTGLHSMYDKANAQGIGEAVAHLAFLLAHGVDYDAENGRAAMTCQSDAVAWMTALQRQSPAYFWIHIRDWIDYFLDQLDHQLPESIFARAQADGERLQIEEVARMVVERTEQFPGC